MSAYVRKGHNVTVLLRHLVFPVKYRGAAFDNVGLPELAKRCVFEQIDHLDNLSLWNAKPLRLNSINFSVNP